MLDSSRGLRMDEPKLSISPHDLGEGRGAGAAPLAICVGRPADDGLPVATPDQVERLPVGLLRESSFAAYCGNERQVSEGFAIALRAMGVEADLSHEDIAPPNNNPNREDN
jgi:hypothetical protein